MRSMRKRRNSNSGKFGCFTLILIVVVNLVIGSWSVNEILSWFGKDIPRIADMVIGLFVGEISIPVAIVGWILKIFGIF